MNAQHNKDEFPGLGGDIGGPDTGELSALDREALKQIGRRTSPTGRVVTVVLIAAVVGLGAWALRNSARYDSRMEPLERAKELRGDELTAALRAAWREAEHEDVKERILLNLGFHQDATAVPLMVEALGQPGVVRRAAARALAHIGSPAADPARPKLLEVLPHTDARDRAQVVWTLAVLREPAAADAILAELSAGHLQRLEDLEHRPAFDPRVVAQAVGAERLASRALLTSPDKAVRTLVALALAESASPASVEPLIMLLEDDDSEVARTAAVGLGRAADPRAAQPLFELMKRKPELRRGILDSLGRSAGGVALARLVQQAQEPELCRLLAKMLEAAHDPTSGAALLPLLRHSDPEVAKSAALALAAIGDENAITPLLELATSDERSAAQRALVALRSFSRSDIADVLLPALSTHPGRKAAILRALGKSGSDRVGAAILKELGGDDVEAAAFALADMRYQPAYARFIAMTKKPAGIDFTQPSAAHEEIVRDREIALRALGRMGDIEAVSTLARIIEDATDSAKLRGVAAEALGQIADTSVLSEVIRAAKNPGVDQATRGYYAQALWQTDVREVRAEVAALIEPSTPAAVRRGAALALGYSADPRNDQLMTDLLRTPEIKREAAFAVILGGSPHAAEELLEQLTDDRDLRDTLQDILVDDGIGYFDRVTLPLFDRGQILRRLEVAYLLRRNEGLSFGYPWQLVIDRLRAGWDGPGGLSPSETRARLWQLLRGDSSDGRRLSAEALAAMGERGMLLASRDTPGNGQAEAQMLLLRDNQ